MDGKQSRELTQILNAIEEGGFGKDELVQRLNALVDRELSQTDRSADMELVQACQDILYRLHHQGETYVSNCAASLARTRKKLRKPQFSLPSISPVTRVAAVLLVLFGGGLVFDLFISGDYLFGMPTPDEQQYIVSGANVESIITIEVEAEQNHRTHTVSTTDFVEAANAFGSIPPLLQWLPEGWGNCHYYVISSSRTKMFSAQYENKRSNEYIKLTIHKYDDVETAKAAFEQNETGVEHIIANHNVYIANNIGNSVAIWHVENTCYTITGPITYSEICQIVESFLQGEISE